MNKWKQQEKKNPVNIIWKQCCMNQVPGPIRRCTMLDLSPKKPNHTYDPCEMCVSVSDCMNKEGRYVFLLWHQMTN